MTKYDNYGRVISTAIITGLSRTEWDNILKNLVIAESRTTAGYTANGMSIFYTNNYFATDVQSILTINYYDSYPSYGFNPSFPTTILDQPVLTGTVDAEGLSTKSLPVMSLVKNIEDDNWTKNYTYYDTRGRAIGSYSINHLGGYTRSYSKLDFSGVPQKTETQHIRKTGEAGILVKERFVYDQQNRLLQHYHQVDSKPEELLADNSYNELSQLSNKKVGNNLQSIDYAYNIRGWMTGINPGEMSVPDLSGKLFSYKIKYNQKEGISYPTSQFSAKEVKPKYNGNIAEVDWRSVENIGNNPSITPKRYGYVYDGLNRLTAGYYQNPNNPYSKENTESLTYDLNGNITNLYRTSVMNSGTNTAMVVDDLEYFYPGNQTNQVNRIIDHSNNPTGYEGGGGSIGYNANGNMIIMQDKGIFPINYNHLNLPNSITRGFEFTSNQVYRADGTKVYKRTVETNGGINGSIVNTTDTDYLDGFQYVHKETTGGGLPGGGGELIEFAVSPMRKAMEIEAFSSRDQLVNPGIGEPGIDPPIGGGFTPIDIVERHDELQFFPTAEGFYDYQKNQYIYQYKDHLGNVRLSFGRNYSGTLEITDNNDYYPFGMNHLKSGNSYFGAGKYQNYKYNGKELQETGMYAMDFRHYMPDVGRFTGMDRISEIMPDWTPYRFAFNNPSYFSDPTGLFEEGGNALAHCPTCPDTKEFQPFINDPNNVYVYNSETNTASLKVTPIEEVVVTGQKSSSVNYAGVDNNISSSLWWTNTAVGAASAYTVYKGQYHLNNELWRYQPYGKQKIITPWSKMKNGRNYWNNNLASKARLGQLEKVKGIRNISSKLTKAGGVLLAADIVLSGEIKPSHIINGAMLGASTTGVGAIVAGAWFIADFGTMGANYLINGEAKGLGDMLDESVGTYEMYDGVY